MNKKAPGKTFLQLTGVILIVTGLISVINACSSIYLSTLLRSGNIPADMQNAMEMMGMTDIDPNMVLMAGIISAVSAALSVAAGAVGVKFCSNLEKGRLCFNMGLALLGMAFVVAAYNIFQGAFSPISMFSSLVFPLFYTWGGARNMQQKQK